MGYNTGGVKHDYVQLTAYQKSLLQSVRMDLVYMSHTFSSDIVSILRTNVRDTAELLLHEKTHD